MLTRRCLPVAAPNSSQLCTTCIGCKPHVPYEPHPRAEYVANVATKLAHIQHIMLVIPPWTFSLSLFCNYPKEISTRAPLRLQLTA